MFYIWHFSQFSIYLFLLLAGGLCNSSVFIILKEINSIDKPYRQLKPHRVFYLAKQKESMLQRQSGLPLSVGSSLLSFTLCLSMGVYLVSSLPFVILTPSFGSTLVPPLQPLCANVSSSFSHEHLSKTMVGPKPPHKYYNGLRVITGQGFP